MGKIGKRKGKVNQFGRRPFTRAQAKADADALAQVQIFRCPHLCRLCFNLHLSYVFNMGYYEDEWESSTTLVSVGAYRVKIVFAPMLRCILEKHGDIAVDCSLTGVKGRSALVQLLCDIMQTLAESKFTWFYESGIIDMLVVVGKLGKLNLRVGWLQKRLEEILDAKKKESSIQESTVKCCYDEIPDKFEELQFEFEALQRKFHLEWEKNAKAAESGLTRESKKARDCFTNELLDFQAKLQELQIVFKVEFFKNSMVEDLY